MTTKLLAVDDSKTMRKVLEITFAGDTYDSTVVGSADEALGAVRSGGVQVAVVDGHLGSTSGYDLCKQIKATAPQIKVMLLSSKQRPYDEGAGSDAGVDGHFDKPFDSTKFLAKLEELGVGEGAPAPTPGPAAVAPPPQPMAASPAPAPIAPRPSAAAQRPQAPPARVPSAAPVATPAKPAVSPVAAASRAPAHPPAIASVASHATGNMEGKLVALGLTSDQVKGVLSLSRDVVEQVVWEVVPALAETLIKEEIARLTSE